MLFESRLHPKHNLNKLNKIQQFTNYTRLLSKIRYASIFNMLFAQKIKENTTSYVNNYFFSQPI